MGKQEVWLIVVGFHVELAGEREGAAGFLAEGAAGFLAAGCVWGLAAADALADSADWLGCRVLALSSSDVHGCDSLMVYLLDVL